VANVYADVFKITQGAGAQKVQLWQDSGAAIKIGNRQQKKENRPSNVYAVASPMVLKHIFSDINVLDFAEKKMRLCERGQLVLRDWDLSADQSCHACEHVFSGGGINLPKPRELPGAPSPNISETRRGIPALPRRQPYSYSSATADPSRSVEVSATIETSATSTNLNCRLQGKSLIESGLRRKSRISIEKRVYRHQLQNRRLLGS